MFTARLAGVVSLAFMLSACSSAPTIPTAKYVDLPRFMGDWYVIANIPTLPERDAYNAIESYKLDPDGSIATTFTFRKGAFDGPGEGHASARLRAEREPNAVWGMQFVWPIKAEYLIAYVDAGYTETIIGRSSRDYVWIMARKPVLPEADYARLVQMVADLGYDMNKLQKVPQRWGDKE